MSQNQPKSFGLRLNILMLRLSRNWLGVALTMLGIYIALPFAAPTLMKLGAEGPARAIYFIYGPFCHQFAFRSFFLYGEQYAYPRYNTGSELIPFETYVKDLPEFQPDRVMDVAGRLVPIGDIYDFSPAFQFASRDFLGNPQMGYKVTLCARDITIYSAMFLAGLLYRHPPIRRRLRPAPILLYALLGLGPIAIDGFSQMLGYPPFNLWPPRETLPIFRVLTGAAFGVMNIWLGFPYLELSMRDTRREIEAKLKHLGITI